MNIKLSENIAAPEGSAVDRYGYLEIRNGKIYSLKAESDVQLKGISFYGLGFGPKEGENIGPKAFANARSVSYMAETWGSQIVRAPVYTSLNTPDYGGYFHEDECSLGEGADGCSVYSSHYINSGFLKGKVAELVAGAVASGQYVIIDWHVLNDSPWIWNQNDGSGGENFYWTAAKEFFAEMSRIYGHLPNVIFELGNEPNRENGIETVDQWHDIYVPWANEMINTIRENSPSNKQNLIIVGTPEWCQKVEVAVNADIIDENVIYSAHYYAGSHGLDTQIGQDILNGIDTALNANKAVMVSEWGSVDESGDGKVYRDESLAWQVELDNRGISSVNWQLSNVDEASSVLKPENEIPDMPTNGGWNETHLTDAGDLIVEILDMHNNPQKYHV
ncbi:endoglucanase A [Photobacterium marinum]|uniref:Endoglucanase A n=2 Tax=Photobacterium marinum TaxID=1056511 RepID=L8JC85_9GAMM|nr:endoglucanase A [Photobacterium marinum]